VAVDLTQVSASSGWLPSDDLTGALNQLRFEPAGLVTVTAVRGSVPRGGDAWMLVFPNRAWGTVGGGHLEWEALAWARQLPSGSVPQHRRINLGPALGQCCGGAVELCCEAVGPSDVPRLQQQLAVRRRPLALFGGGHVGHALVRALLPLPFQTRWVDSRETVFPTDLPAHVVVDASDPVEAAVADLAPGSFVLIMSFSHAEDLEILRKCLERQAERGDLPFIGLIGSLTKWAVFQRRLLARGLPQALLDQVTCPIGLPGIEGKQPAVIAASVVAQLLLQAVRPMPHEDFEK
jgi:xanthine dehydrogenase accessory factor